MYSTKISLFFSIILEHIDYFPTCKEFKTSFSVEIGLLHSPPFLNSCFQLHTVVQPTVSHVLLQHPNWYVASMTVQPHLSLRHRSFPFISLGSSGTFTLLFGLLKQQMKGCQFHNNEEVEMASCECRRVINTVMKFLNFYQGWTHAAVCSVTFNILMTFTLNLYWTSY